MLWCFVANGVICCVIALTFSSTAKSPCSITVILITLKELKANYMLEDCYVHIR